MLRVARSAIVVFAVPAETDAWKMVDTGPSGMNYALGSVVDWGFDQASR